MKSSKELNNDLLYRPLKWMCFLSLIGFILCIIGDSSQWFAFTHFDDIKSNHEFEDEIEKWMDSGLQLTDFTIQKLANLYLIRSIFDVLALLGVALMYSRLKLGFVIYSIFQLSYVLSPYILMGALGSVLVPYTISLVHIVYIVLFFTQFKKLK